MAAEAAKARAAAIAAKLSASLAGGGAPVGASMMSSTPSFGLEASTELGKRKARWSEQVEAPSSYGNGGGGAGFGASKRNKVPIPEHLARGGSIMGMLLGPKGSTIRAMQEKTGAKIQIRGRGSNPKPGDDHDADEPLHVMIEGSDQAVSSATREIQSILHNPEEANRLKHQQLTDLASMRSGMGMNTSGMPSANSPYGPPSNLGGAQYSGSSLMGGASNGGGVDEAAFEIPNAMVGVVIGRGGENIQRIQREFGVNIQIAKSTDIPPGAVARPITLKGPPQALAAAKAEVMNLINDRQQQQQQHMGGGGGGQQGTYGGGGNAGLGSYSANETITMTIPNDKVGLVIGKGGATIKGIQSRTQASVQIPPTPDADNPACRTITISGASTQQVEIAVSEVRSVIDAGVQGLAPPGGSATIVQYYAAGIYVFINVCSVIDASVQGLAPPGGSATIVQVPDDRVGLIIGKAGNTIKEMQARHGVRIQIPPTADPGTRYRSVSITGPGDAANRCKYDVEKLLANDMAQNPRQGDRGGPPFQQPPQQPPQQQQPMPQYGAPPPGYAPSPYLPPMAPAPMPYGVPIAQAIVSVPSPLQQCSGHRIRQFWQYAAYYGERVAREQYGAWAPPAGTPPPPGTVLPPPAQSSTGLNGII
ncbi:hypothetical protein JKP88DRAFT_266825, partial [Tribonema minus]